MDRLQPTNQKIWTGRIDSQSDPSQFRLHQVIKAVDINQLKGLDSGFSLLGYACDEGVSRNKGKIGAVAGPEAFRKAFANLAAHDFPPIHDLGNVTCEDGVLEATQEQFSNVVSEALYAKQKLIAIGGGHDIAYGHFSGIRKALGKEAKIGIINFDAHFDLREVSEQSSSGTPFWQIAQQETDFNYCCVGIQQSANTKKLFRTVEENGVSVILRNDMGEQRAERLLKDFIGSVDFLYLTIDLDGFDMSLCPGVSAPTVNGFSYQEVLPYLRMIMTSKKLISADIAELNPAYDQRQQTAKVAASLTYEIMSNWS